MSSESQVFAHQRLIVERLSENFDSISVITASPLTEKLTKNYQVVSTNWRVGRPISNVIRFYIVALPILIKNRNGIIFSHMTEVQSLLATPLCLIFNIRQYLWYAHTSNPLRLRILVPFLSGIFTSTRNSCPVRHHKVRCIGQSVDEQLSDCVDMPNYREEISFYHVGRLDPSKRVETIIEVVETIKNWGYSAKLDLYGAPSSNKTESYAKDLIETFTKSPYQDWLKFRGTISRDELISKSLTHQVFIHAFQGSLDKSLIEATLLKRYVITCNREYLGEFGVNVNLDHTDLDLLIQQIKTFFSYSTAAKNNEISRRLEIAKAKHSLSNWVDNVTKCIKEN
jgi:glycosyltransferase involved in cell wall biosynthesis